MPAGRSVCAGERSCSPRLTQSSGGRRPTHKPSFCQWPLHCLSVCEFLPPNKKMRKHMWEIAQVYYAFPNLRWQVLKYTTLEMIITKQTRKVIMTENGDPNDHHNSPIKVVLLMIWTELPWTNLKWLSADTSYGQEIHLSSFSLCLQYSKFCLNACCIKHLQASGDESRPSIKCHKSFFLRDTCHWGHFVLEIFLTGLDLDLLSWSFVLILYPHPLSWFFILIFYTESGFLILFSGNFPWSLHCRDVCCLGPRTGLDPDIWPPAQTSSGKV